MITEPTPAFDKLRTMRETFEIGLRAAEITGNATNAQWYQEGLQKTEAQIKALTNQIGEARREERRLLRKAYAAKQVTPREFGAAMRRLVRGC